MHGHAFAARINARLSDPRTCTCRTRSMEYINQCTCRDGGALLRPSQSLRLWTCTASCEKMMQAHHLTQTYVELLSWTALQHVLPAWCSLMCTYTGSFAPAAYSHERSRFGSLERRPQSREDRLLHLMIHEVRSRLICALRAKPQSCARKFERFNATGAPLSRSETLCNRTFLEHRCLEIRTRSLLSR